jgi:uncharacterized membrane protein YqaE (UPF0057 family)
LQAAAPEDLGASETAAFPMLVRFRVCCDPGLMRRFQGSMMIGVAILLPWLALLLQKRVFQAAFCLGLQLSVIGWIPAAIWAVLVVNDDRRQRQYREMLRVLHGR